MSQTPNQGNTGTDDTRTAKRAKQLIHDLEHGRSFSQPILLCIVDLLGIPMAAPLQYREEIVRKYGLKLRPTTPNDYDALSFIADLTDGREPSRDIRNLVRKAIEGRLKEDGSKTGEKDRSYETTQAAAGKESVKDEPPKTTDYIFCRLDRSHKNHTRVNVLCAHCHAPLFKVRWWYHVVFLQLCLFSIGLTIGQYRSVLLPTAIVQLLFGVYIAILFRKADVGRRVLVASMVLVTFLIVFLQKFGDMGYSALDTARAGCLYLSVGFFLIAYWVAWTNEYDDSAAELFESLPALAMGWFLIILCVDSINGRYLQFMNPKVVSIIKQQIYLRESLFGLSMLCYVVLAVIRTTRRQIIAPRDFLTPHIQVDLQSPSPQFLLFVIIKTIRNTMLTIYKWTFEIIIACINLTIYLGVLMAKWVTGFFQELFDLLVTFFRLFSLAFIAFLRNSVIPFIILCVINISIITLLGYLSTYINEGAHYWTAEELTEAAIQFVAIQIGIVLIVWLVPSNQIGFREAVHSIAITNTALSLLIILYATVVAWELHWSARYLSVSPFKNIGFFTQYISIGFGVCMLVVVIVNKLRARVSS